MAQTVKCLPAIQKTWVQSLGWEDPQEKEMATHSSTLAGKIPWTEKPDRLQSMESQRVRHDWVTSLSLSLFIVLKSVIGFRFFGRPIQLMILLIPWASNLIVSIFSFEIHPYTLRKWVSEWFDYKSPFYFGANIYQKHKNKF